MLKRRKKIRYLEKVCARKSRDARHEDVTYPTSILDDVFDTEFK